MTFTAGLARSVNRACHHARPGDMDGLPWPVMPIVADSNYGIKFHDQSFNSP